MILFGGIIAIIGVGLATVQQVGCESKMMDLFNVCSHELQNPSNNKMQFKDEFPLTDKHEASLHELSKTDSSAEVVQKTLMLIYRWQIKLKDLNKGDSDKQVSGGKRTELESAITYAYYLLVKAYYTNDEHIASLVALNHLKALRIRYKGVAMSKVFDYERSLLKVVKASGIKSLNRLLGVKDDAKCEQLCAKHKCLKRSIIPADYTGRLDYMQSMIKLVDVAYELRMQHFIEPDHKRCTCGGERGGKSLGPVELRFEAHEESNDWDCKHCDNPPWVYKPPLPASYNNLWIFKCNNPNCRRRKELGLLKN